MSDELRAVLADRGEALFAELDLGAHRLEGAQPRKRHAASRSDERTSRLAPRCALVACANAEGQGREGAKGHARGAGAREGECAVPLCVGDETRERVVVRAPVHRSAPQVLKSRRARESRA